MHPTPASERKENPKMSKKEKPLVCLVLSREALDSAVAEVATLKIQYTAAKAALELEIAALQERRQGHLLSLAKQIESREAGVFVYCQQHRNKLFPEKKSLDLLLATVGYRTEPPSVEKCSKKDTWSAIARRLETLPWGALYFTTPEPEVDKKALLSARDRLTGEQLAEAGIRFEQDELFYITPKSDVADKTVMEAA
jgi:phage host-nuclease inhibitor protein Gam